MFTIMVEEIWCLSPMLLTTKFHSRLDQKYSSSTGFILLRRRPPTEGLCYLISEELYLAN